jgi:hypothetical protein
VVGPAVALLDVRSEHKEIPFPRRSLSRLEVAAGRSMVSCLSPAYRVSLMDISPSLLSLPTLARLEVATGRSMRFPAS